MSSFGISLLLLPIFHAEFHSALRGPSELIGMNLVNFIILLYPLNHTCLHSLAFSKQHLQYRFLVYDANHIVFLVRRLSASSSTNFCWWLSSPFPSPHSLLVPTFSISRWFLCCSSSSSVCCIRSLATFSNRWYSSCSGRTNSANTLRRSTKIWVNSIAITLTRRCNERWITKKRAGVIAHKNMAVVKFCSIFYLFCCSSQCCG